MALVPQNFFSKSSFFLQKQLHLPISLYYHPGSVYLSSKKKIKKMKIHCSDSSSSTTEISEDPSNLMTANKVM